MGSYAGDIIDLFSPDDGDEENERTEPLGTRLRGRAADVDIDPVDAVRELRERR